MLPPAGQICKKCHPLENVERFSELFFVVFAVFKQGASRGAASSGSDLRKNVIPFENVERFVHFLFFCDFQAGG